MIRLIVCVDIFMTCSFAIFAVELISRFDTFVFFVTITIHTFARTGLTTYFSFVATSRFDAMFADGTSSAAIFAIRRN